MSPRQRYGEKLPALHETIEPADIRKLDRVLGRIRKRGSESEFSDIRIWKLSPLGVELVDESNDQNFQKGDSIDLQIVVSGQRSLFEGLIVDVVDRGPEISLLGVRLSSGSGERTTDDDKERRNKTRWICSQEFYPTCIAISPGRYNDYIYFQIRDISADGLRLTCSLRNKFLLQGMVLKLIISLPLVGEANAVVKVSRVGLSTEGGRDFLVIGGEFVNLSENAKSAFAQYLIQFSNVEDLDSLRHQGFLPESVADGVDFYFLKSEQDYRKVLDLRFLAHKLDGNFTGENVRSEDLADIRDASGRILVGKYQDKVVATGRIHFPDVDTPLEQEDYIKWPENLPRRDQIVELGRVCTDPNFRRGDLFSRILQQVVATCIRNERPYVLVVSLPPLLNLYKKLGCVDTGITHEQEFWKGEQHLLIVNGLDVCLGKGVNPLTWNFFYKEPFEYLLQNGMIDVAGMDRVRIVIYKSFSWVSKLLQLFTSYTKR